MSVNRSLQATFLNDEDGNVVGVVLDGSVYRLQTIGKLANVAGTTINPATEDTLATIDGVLDSIKDTDGIKKITDALPAGTNLLGKVQMANADGDSAGVHKDHSNISFATAVSDLRSAELLQQIAASLREMNAHLRIITDETFVEEETK